jgi:hypothetical protein
VDGRNTAIGQWSGCKEDAMPKRKKGPPRVAQDERDFFDLDVSPPVFDLYQRANERRIQTTYRSPPSTLYHYTTPAGLLGIIENNKLWATHINYLNDATELGYARELVETALARHARTTRSPHVREFVHRARQTFDVSKTMDVFVACFCEDGDLLSQWRGYAQTGEGYSIGVGADQLGKIGSGLNYFLGQVVYDRAVQGSVVDDILEACCAGALRLTAGMSVEAASTVVDELCQVFRRAIWFLMVTFKDAMFKEENEWRAIEIMNQTETAKRVRFRSTSSKLIPYVELDFSTMQPVSPYPKLDKIPIVEVFHGPTLNPILSSRALGLLLAKHGQARATVQGSRIPLRL